MPFFAHTREGLPKDEWQTIQEHSEHVAAEVCDFSSEWCDESFAWNLGLLHDIGKYQDDFQRRLEGKAGAVEHSLCGAIECVRPGGIGDAGAYCIAGHHSGLPDIGTQLDDAEMSTLLGRLRRHPQDYSAFRSELSPLSLKEPKWKDAVVTPKEYAFWIRMMYSCLTDADFLDTERFCSGDRERGIYADFVLCKRLLENRLREFASDTPVADARAQLQEQVISHSNDDAQIYFMNMPTGSGKTLASMNFALTRAIKGGKKHIIYVIPYTSIIEQNAKVFKSIFGADRVLEHHSNFDPEQAEELSTREKLSRSAENWDASIVVTTNVQFFESIYDNRSSRLRKLHHMADSILVFDEVHMFPSKFYQPCLEAIGILTKRYRCEAVFLSATMPDFSVWLDRFDCGGMKTLDLIPDKSSYPVFSRCAVKDRGALSLEALVYEARQAQSCLIVVNSRKAARKVFEALPDSDNKFHLSTYMTHEDRDRVIEEVKRLLAAGEQVVLVSTSLIEAGVDLDFERVYRESAGLDNLLQAAGRCNREGRRTGCTAYSFSFEEESGNKAFRTQQFLCEDAMKQFPDVSSPEAVKYYFDKLYGYQKKEMSSMDFSSAIRPIRNGYGFAFAEYASSFRLIDEDTRSLVIMHSDNREDVEKCLARLEFGGREARRKLQRYAVNLRPYEFEKLAEARVVAETAGVYYLTNERYYNRDIGIQFEEAGDCVF